VDRRIAADRVREEALGLKFEKDAKPSSMVEEDQPNAPSKASAA